MAKGKKGGSLGVPGGRGFMDLIGQVRSGVQDRAKKIGGTLSVPGGRGFLDVIRRGALGAAGLGIHKRKGGAIGVAGGRGLFTPGGSKRGSGRVIMSMKR